MTPAMDPIDHIMHVMDQAFDPAFGEAWNRRQVTDALTMSNCRYVLGDDCGEMPDETREAAGFILSRQAADEEELLLIAVRPESRRRGVATILMQLLIAQARERGVTQLFLEMREGNPAERLYCKMGFQPIGRRPNYYNRGEITGIDAITFALPIT